LFQSIERETFEMNSGTADIAVIIPHYQKAPGLLAVAVRSAFNQTVAHRLLVIVCDDGSPSPATVELASFPERATGRLLVVQQANAGAGAARNRALDSIPEGVRYVAFLDSDDVWRPAHIERAVAALERGYDAYFADFVAVGYPGVGNMARIGTLHEADHPVLDASLHLHALAVTPLEHLVADGGGLIQTSTVVYRHEKFPQLRFREEFFNGQDFFFWIDLGEQGARFAFSYNIECDNGEGINIFQSAGWGSEKSLRRIRNELFVWTSVERFYKMSAELRRLNRKTIRSLQKTAGLDLLHRLRRGKPLDLTQVADMSRMAPSTAWVIPVSVAQALAKRLSGARDGQ
jgi:succinoglycan biosynthesis protein ExoW